MTVKSLLAGLVLAVLVALVVGEPGEQRSDSHFEAPGLINVVPRGVQGVARDLTRSGGRMRAVRSLDMVFAWLPDADGLVVHAPKGAVELLLGDRDGPGLTLRFGEDTLTLEGRSAEGAAVESTLPRPDGDRLGLSRDERGLALVVDGVEASRLGDDPLPDGGLVSIGLGKGASIRGFAVTPAKGEPREIDLGGAKGGLSLSQWAGLTTLLGVLSLMSWWALASGRRSARLGDWVPAVAGLVLLLVCANHGLEQRNRARFESSVGPWAKKEFAFSGSRRIAPGRPLDLHPRRDADARLALDVVLGEDSVLDVLIRGDDPGSDRGVIVSLSTAADAGGAVLLNHGLDLQSTPAPDALSRLEPGRTYRLRIDTTGPETRVRLDDADYGRTWDWDLRAGRTAFHSLRGQATVSRFSLEPTGDPEDIAPHLSRWEFSLSAIIVGVALLLLAMQRQSPQALLWSWPLMAALAPGAPEASLVVAVILSTLLLLASCSGPWMVPSWALGGALTAVLCWSASEGPPDYSPFQLSMMTSADFGGPPVPERLLWARHPLTRRFNGYVRDQTLRSYPVPKEHAEVRIISVGSSSTFGYGVPHKRTWSTQLEDRLTKQGLDVEVLNGGMPGSTSVRLVSSVREVIMPLQPDIVIVSLGFNDHSITAMDNDAAHLKAMTTTGLSWFEVQVERARQWLRHRARAQYAGAVSRGEPLDDDDVQRFSTAPAQLFGNALQQMADAVSAGGATLVFIEEPCKDGATRPLLQPFRKAMAEVAARNDLLLIKPQTLLDSTKGAVYLDAVHPTALGHWLMADLLATELVKAGLVGG